MKQWFVVFLSLAIFSPFARADGLSRSDKNSLIWLLNRDFLSYEVGGVKEGKYTVKIKTISCNFSLSQCLLDLDLSYYNQSESDVTMSDKFSYHIQRTDHQAQCTIKYLSSPLDVVINVGTFAARITDKFSFAVTSCVETLIEKLN